MCYLDKVVWLTCSDESQKISSIRKSIKLSSTQQQVTVSLPSSIPSLVDFHQPGSTESPGKARVVLLQQTAAKQQSAQMIFIALIVGLLSPAVRGSESGKPFSATQSGMAFLPPIQSRVFHGNLVEPNRYPWLVVIK